MTHLVERLAELRLHDYVALDLDRVVEALDSLDPVERFYAVVHSILSEGRT